MKISEIQLVEPKDGLIPFHIRSLGSIVVLAGRNGSGKTRILKLMERYVKSLQRGEEEGCLMLKIQEGLGTKEASEVLGRENASKMEIVNYSYYDAQLQSPKEFTPYVISRAKELLKTCDYEQTALNSLLLLEDMVQEYSEEFKGGGELQKFLEEFAVPFHIQGEKDRETGRLKLCGQFTEEIALSPGQQYLLRIAVACYRNLCNDKMVFFMDEPELHLHPQAQIALLQALRGKFPGTQFWIATHSLSLISYLSVSEQDTTVLYLEDGKTDILRSNSSQLLNGLIGEEENRFAIRQLMAEPDEYACNRFAVECQNPPKVMGAVNRDAQMELLWADFHENVVVLDYGAGKGRLLEELSGESMDIVRKISYYAYDVSDRYAAQCRNIMNRCGSTAENYYDDRDELLNQLSGKTDYVLLVNVLHEIEPEEWPDMFRFIQKLLKDKGKLIIVEREELTVGEAPYQNGFLMITENGAKELFGKENFVCDRHERKKYIVKYTVEREGLDVTMERVVRCVEAIREDALETVRALKRSAEEKETDLKKYYAGIRLAFYLHQYANASLILGDVVY